MLFSDCGAEKGVTASAPSADKPGPPFNVGQGEYIDRAYNESPRGGVVVTGSAVCQLYWCSSVTIYTMLGPHSCCGRLWCRSQEWQLLIMLKYESVEQDSLWPAGRNECVYWNQSAGSLEFVSNNDFYSLWNECCRNYLAMSFSDKKQLGLKKHVTEKQLPETFQKDKIFSNIFFWFSCFFSSGRFQNSPFKSKSGKKQTEEGFNYWSISAKVVFEFAHLFWAFGTWPPSAPLIRRAAEYCL